MNQKVQATVWHYVPNFYGDDVDKDFLGDIIGTVESIAPNILKIKVEKFKPNFVNAEWTEDLTAIKWACHYKDGYLEEWDYNAQRV